MTAQNVEVRPSPIDQRPRQILERYATLVGTVLMETGEGLAELEIPAGEWRHWAGERKVVVAFTPEALESDSDALLLVVGSTVHERLLEAIRSRGFRNNIGLVPATKHLDGSAMLAPVPVDGAQVGATTTELSVLPIGRLLVRASIRAGPALEERLIESPLVDLSTGARIPSALADTLALAREFEVLPEGATLVSIRPIDELLPLLFEGLEAELHGELSRVGAEASRSLAEEIARLERYYNAMIRETESEGSADSAYRKQAIAAELGRRRGEEEDRFKTRVVVHPVQLLEWKMLAQRTSWSLTTTRGRQATLTATRFLAGDTTWVVTCPTCGATLTAARVCKHGHLACPICSDECALCHEFACRHHGLATCEIAAHPVCGAHRRDCEICKRGHCEVHSVRCEFADHLVCPDCATACARCGTTLCRSHALQTAQDAPNGQRWLCESCVVYCEGGANEPVGLDETERCTACERYICRNHRVTCAVDGQVLCSRHLRRSDRSGRLVCERHQASCEEEPTSILASDEVQLCATCQKPICEEHGSDCLEDRAHHCHRHLALLADAPGRKGCEKHRSVCHVDGVVYSLVGTRACPVCARSACDKHRMACVSCARQVCVRDVEKDTCLTCTRLSSVADLEDNLIQAAIVANAGEPLKAREWRMARDAGGSVVQAELGWARRLIFTVPHGDTRPQTVVRRSLMGRKRLR